jgi:hypothetical protein
MLAEEMRRDNVLTSSAAVHDHFWPLGPRMNCRAFFEDETWGAGDLAASMIFNDRFGARWPSGRGRLPALK